MIGGGALIIAALIGGIATIIARRDDRPVTPSTNANVAAEVSNSLVPPADPPAPKEIVEPQIERPMRRQARAHREAQVPQQADGRDSINISTNCSITNSTINDVTVQDCSGNVRR